MCSADYGIRNLAYLLSKMNVNMCSADYGIRNLALLLSEIVSE